MNDTAQSYLPESAQELIDLIGFEQAEKLFKQFGGTYLDVPQNPDNASQLSGILSREAVVALCGYFHGARIEYVPKLDKAVVAERNARVLAECGRLPVREIARNHGITRNRVYQIVKAAGNAVDSDQIRLF